MCLITGICSNLFSKNANSCLKTNEEAKIPSKVMKTKSNKNEITVFTNGLGVKPTNEKTPSKN